MAGTATAPKAGTGGGTTSPGAPVTGTVDIGIRALNKGGVDYDFVVVEVEGRDLRFAFQVSPKGTVDAAVVKTTIPKAHEAGFKKAVEAKREVVVEQNPKWDDVKTDDGKDGDTTAGDGKNDNDNIRNGGRYNWVNDVMAPVYEIV